MTTQTWFDSSKYLFDRYSFLKDSYLGSGGFITGDYLLPHVRESQEKFVRRQLLAIYPNYVKKVITSYLGALFRQPIQRTITSPVYQQFSSNTDGFSRSISKAMKHAYRNSLIHGTAYIIVDRANITPSLTIAEEALPYLSLRLPYEVMNYLFDQSGRLDTITFSETDPNNTIQYRTFTKTGWFISVSESQSRMNRPTNPLEVFTTNTAITASGEHNLGEVPVVMLHNHEPIEHTAMIQVTPWIESIAKINLDLYNAISELRELFRQQVFNVLTIPISQQLLSGDTDVPPVEISTDNILAYDPSLGGAPSYLAPDASPITSYLEYIKTLCSLIYEQACLEFIGAGLVSNASSGVAFSYQFNQMNNILTDMATQCEEAEMNIARLVCKWMGESVPEGTIAYPRNYDIIDLQKELQLGMDSITANISATFDAEIKKRLARELLGQKVDQSVLDTIDTEIDENKSAPPLGQAPFGQTPSGQAPSGQTPPQTPALRTVKA